MLVLEQVVLTVGRPLSVYHDRHSIFEHTPRRMVEWSIEEQLKGERQPTQFGRVLQELEINSIAARSPQAKGRVESGEWRGLNCEARTRHTTRAASKRLVLVMELRLAGACTLQE